MSEAATNRKVDVLFVTILPWNLFRYLRQGILGSPASPGLKNVLL
jgi:hypothetical protein